MHFYQINGHEIDFSLIYLCNGYEKHNTITIFKTGWQCQQLNIQYKGPL